MQGSMKSDKTGPFMFWGSILRLCVVVVQMGSVHRLFCILKNRVLGWACSPRLRSLRPHVRLRNLFLGASCAKTPSR